MTKVDFYHVIKFFLVYYNFTIFLLLTSLYIKISFVQFWSDSLFSILRVSIDILLTWIWPLQLAINLFPKLFNQFSSISVELLSVQ